MKHFKKTRPYNPVILPTGEAIRFEPVDATVGIYVTKNLTEEQMLALAIEKQIGGVSEITRVEYDKLAEAKKNNPPSPRRWREELSKPLNQPTTSPPRAVRESAAAAVTKAETKEAVAKVEAEESKEFVRPKAVAPKQ